MTDELRLALAEVLRKAGVERLISCARVCACWPKN